MEEFPFLHSSCNAEGLRQPVELHYDTVKPCCLSTLLIQSLHFDYITWILAQNNNKKKTTQAWKPSLFLLLACEKKFSCGVYSVARP